MKKGIVVLLFLFLTSFTVSAKDKDTIDFDVFVGLTYELPATTNTGVQLVDNLNLLTSILTNFRVGGGADLHFKFLDPFSFGVEVGFFVFATDNQQGETQVTPFFDIPVRAIVRLDLGGIALQVHGGYNFSTTFNLLAASSNYMDIIHRFDLGGRVMLGPIYLEYSRLFWQPNASSLNAGSNRFGIGAIFNLF